MGRRIGAGGRAARPCGAPAGQVRTHSPYINWAPVVGHREGGMQLSEAVWGARHEWEEYNSNPRPLVASYTGVRRSLESPTLPYSPDSERGLHAPAALPRSALHHVAGGCPAGWGASLPAVVATGAVRLTCELPFVFCRPSRFVVGCCWGSSFLGCCSLLGAIAAAPAARGLLRPCCMGLAVAAAPPAWGRLQPLMQLSRLTSPAS